MARPRIAAAGSAREGGTTTDRAAPSQRRGAAARARRAPAAPSAPIPSDGPGSEHGYPSDRAAVDARQAMHPRQPARAAPPLETPQDRDQLPTRTIPGTPPVLETTYNDEPGAAFGDLRVQARREGAPPTRPPSSQIEKWPHPPIQAGAVC